jgi:transcriptional regulator NrdR family protein
LEDGSFIKGEDQQSDDSSGGAYESHLPIIGMIKSTSTCVMTIYSLKNETALTVWRFASTILMFQSSVINPSNKAVVLLSEGIIQVINLKTMQSEVSLPTYYIQSHQMQSQDLTQLLIANLPKQMDVSSSSYAYVHKEINKEDSLVELKK